MNCEWHTKSDIPSHALPGLDLCEMCLWLWNDSQRRLFLGVTVNEPAELLALMFRRLGRAHLRQ